jgi:hypothetical protein
MDGQVALLVPLNDQRTLAHELGRLMVDADLRRLLGNKARKSVTDRFALNEVLRQWDNLFEEVGVKH